MLRLLADRFLADGARWVDLATGSVVRVRTALAGSRDAHALWEDRCATLSRLRHPLMNPLIDFGAADSTRVFEAYAASTPLRLGSRVAVGIIRHAARFCESNGLAVTCDDAEFVMRSVEKGGSSRDRALGVVLQPRGVLEQISMAIAAAGPGGMTVIEVFGPAASGLRTVHLLAARASRLEGYLPLRPAMLQRYGELIAIAGDRHVALFLAEDASDAERARAAAFAADLGTKSGRHHVLLQFRRSSCTGDRGLRVEPMGTRAMSAMVYRDVEAGPSYDELFGAIRVADGRPGMLVTALRGVPERGWLRAAFVHESSPAYVIDRPVEATLRRQAARRVASALLRADSRAAGLAANGRHAAALRLLRRAGRVFDGRNNTSLAAACALRAGWILRDRGRSLEALDRFEHAQRAGADPDASVRAAIAVGVVLTDLERHADAEAALRSARAAAAVVRNTELTVASTLGLCRSLFWQARYDEALGILDPVLAGESIVQAQILAARIRLRCCDIASAATLANAALTRAQEPRDIASAARVSVEARGTLGDLDGARRDAARGLAAATSFHQPIVALRLRIALLTALKPCVSGRLEAERLQSSIASALRRSVLPPLLRTEFSRACAMAASPLHMSPRDGLSELRQFLEAAHSAEDEHAALEQVCGELCSRLSAATVQIVAARPAGAVITRVGRPWQPDMPLVQRVLAGGPSAVLTGSEPRHAVEAVRFGQEVIAVVACRWTAGAEFLEAHIAPLLRAAALASAASVRTLLDRHDDQPSNATWGDILGSSDAVARLRDAIVRAGRAPFPVLIEGESGSGKELVARAIHRLSVRRDRRLSVINCAAITDDLLEAELFGHARGAFTGASTERAGLFEEADGGTLFLDEIGELSPRAQAKLLRVLQDGEIRRVGENLPRRVDTRVIAATNRSLEYEVESGRFRKDLRFRLDVVRIAVPPLRERAGDIPLLAVHFWQEAATRVGSRATLSPEMLAALARYEWPGNVRELQNIVASLAVHGPRRGRLVPALLPASLSRATMAPDTTFDAARSEFERRFVLAALARAGGHRARAASSLGVTRQGLAKMLRRLRIEA